MITGYNTDVPRGEVTFHVQTEDKGLGNPYIESLVYVGGQVLASKRASYAELLAEGRNDKEIVALMDHQHRTMIAAIRHGKLDAKLQALLAGKQTGPTAAPDEAPTLSSTASHPVAVVAPQRGETTETVVRPPERRSGQPERTLDQVILEYLTSEADQEQLVLMLEGEQELAPGRRALLSLRTSSSKSGNPIPGSQVSVRMISTVVEPRTLAAGRTDDQGGLTLSFDIPQLGRGTSALIISAASTIGRAELKHLL
jgi:hypothetical protein